MCRHTFKKLGSGNGQITCTFSHYFQGSPLVEKPSQLIIYDLPVDKKGICVFHSKDIPWKLKNQFHERLLDLIQRIDSDKTAESIDLNEITVVGFDDYATRDQFESMGRYVSLYKRILLSDLELSKPLLFKRAVFVHNLFIEVCKFESLDFESAVFKGTFELKSSHVVQNTSFIRCKAEHDFFVEATTFEQIVELSEATFNKQVLLLDVQFRQQAVFDKVKFTDTDDVNFIQINASFGGYTSFQEASFPSIVHFTRCRFSDEIHFIDTRFGNRLHVDFATIYFQSNKESQKLFQADVEFDFDEHTFEGSGQIIFENANLFNLNSAFKQNLRELERLQRVVIRKGCLRYRLTFQHIFQDTTQIENFVIKDFHQLLVNYFEARFQLRLYVEFDYIDHGLLVTIHSDENINIESFDELLQKARSEVVELIRTEKTVIGLPHAEYFKMSAKRQRTNSTILSFLSKIGFLMELNPDQ